MVAANPITIENAVHVIRSVRTAKDNPDLVKALHDGMTAIRASGAEKAIYERDHVDLT
jgi:polar amino acid transport system substrate-binding protein